MPTLQFVTQGDEILIPLKNVRGAVLAELMEQFASVEDHGLKIHHDHAVRIAELVTARLYPPNAPASRPRLD